MTEALNASENLNFVVKKNLLLQKFLIINASVQFAPSKFLSQQPEFEFKLKTLEFQLPNLSFNCANFNLNYQNLSVFCQNFNRN